MGVAGDDHPLLRCLRVVAKLRLRHSSRPVHTVKIALTRVVLRIFRALNDPVSIAQLDALTLLKVSSQHNLLLLDIIACE